MKLNTRRLQKVEKLCNSLGLQYTFRSIEYLLDTEETTFAQLRLAYIRVSDGFEYSPEKTAILLIKAGLIGSKQCTSENLDELNNKTEKIVDNWISKVGSLQLLYVLLMKQLEERHFFMSSAEVETIAQIQHYQSSMTSLTDALLKDHLKLQKITTIQAREIILKTPIKIYTLMLSSL